MTQPRLIASRYELGELIGYGGMAEVHRGRDVRLGRDVAIKVLRSDLARDQTFLNRFRREAQAAAGLNHPAIVSVYDTGEDHTPDGPVPFIVMEYVSGRTLRDVLKAEGRLPAERAMQITADICGALDFSHQNSIVHRDIKPANVMITETGAVKVMDFGIARAMSDNSATVTQTAAVIGTAQYLSPEQARGELVDARSDVYSVGCLLYELLTGTPPFTGDSPVAVAYQHVRETAPPPSSIDPSVPRALDSIVMKALAKNPLNRYQSAGEMRTDLHRALSDLPVQAETVLTEDERTQFIARADDVPASLTPLPGESDHRRRRSAVIWAAVVVALLLVIGATSLIVFNANSDSPKMVTVPNLIGQTTAAANNTLRQAGFTVASGDPSTASKCGVNADGSQAVAVGNVCTQQFAPNDKQKEGTTISYTVYAIPSVILHSEINKTLADATNDLQAQKLSVTSTTVDSPAPAGQVIAQSPVAGTSVPENSSVTLQISSGKVVLQSVLNLKFQDALNQLNGQGWTAVNTTPTNVATTDKTKDGLVAAMNPQPNIAYPQTTPITLSVYVYTPTPTPSPSPCASASASATASVSASATSSGTAAASPSC